MSAATATPTKTKTLATSAAGPDLHPIAETLKRARNRAVPLLAVETPDPAATRQHMLGALDAETPAVEWDFIRGLRGVNGPGVVMLTAMARNFNLKLDLTIGNGAVALRMVTDAGLKPEGFGVVGMSDPNALPGVPKGTVVFIHNAHLFLDQTGFLQAVWNARDSFKLNQRTLVLLGPGFRLPPELAGNVIVLDEKLPTREHLGVVVDEIYALAKDNQKVKTMAALTPDMRTAALDALVGLPEFTAEQVLSLSLTAKGVDLGRLWSHKVKAIENTPGLSVWKGTEADSLANLAGIDNAVAYMQQLIAADVFRAIVFVDEGDKSMAGGLSDWVGDNGVSKDQIGQVLTFMEDTRSYGILLAGVAGTGKTQLAKATAASAKKPLILFDLGGMRSGRVGASESQTRGGLKMVLAVAEGRVLFIMTANKTTQFSPELNRRFADQFFFDTPDDAGRAAIWPIYVKQYGLTPEQATFAPGWDAGWTGAEIRRAAERAALFNQTVVQASKHIVPQAVSQRDIIHRMRTEASGRFLSASKLGDLYWAPGDGPDAATVTVPTASGRTFSIEAKE